MAAHILTVTDTMFKSVKPGYWVGDHGSVLSCRGKEPRILRPTPQKRGHMAVTLGRRDSRYVHRLVLEAFVGSCPSGMEALHGDGNPSNNRLDNLRWGTRLENVHDAIRHGTAFDIGAVTGESCPHSVLTETTVREIMRLRRETGAGAVRIADTLGIPRAWRGAIEGVCRGQSWNHVTGLPPYAPKSRRSGGTTRTADKAV